MSATRYSQNDEEDVILSFFDAGVGRFLDIGAFDGISLSNTRALAERGWSGIMVEPSPFNLCPLIESLKVFNGRVEAWSCAVNATGDPAVLKMTQEKSVMWANTISEHEVPSPVNVTLRVECVRIHDLLKHGPFDFISIDAEYLDFEILKDSPRGLYGCKMLCIEVPGPSRREEMKAYIESNIGFDIFHETNENIIAVSRE
jgi:FkbM family methyltransferase